MVMMLSGLMMMTLMTSTSICIVDALPCRHPTPVSVITSQIFHSSPSLSMLKKPEDYYQAFGESSSKSYSFPTQGNLDPPSQPLKRFPLRETKDARKPSHTKPRPQGNKRRLKRYVPVGYVEETTAGKSMISSETSSRFTSPQLQRYQRVATEMNSLPLSPIPIVVTVPDPY
jgi:hypothetical protein